ncbi:MAG TPA: pectate lyase, partial [Bacteroidetes bacterium]|nr:pectate lyase [Bacteroidota bacterium]
MFKHLFCLILSVVLSLPAFSQQPAFPGAEGGGMYTRGGRGGKVLEVTSLLDDGSTGTFRWAVNQTGARTVVFRVSGTIILNSRLVITKDSITIAGQTAPGDGICLRKYPLEVSANEVIIRFLRFRLGDESGGDYDAFSAYTNNL